jgi:Glucodextranase, domain B
MGHLVCRAAITLAGLTVASLSAAPANAAITSTQITRPAKAPVYLLYNEDAPNAIAVSGTTDSTNAMVDRVDLLCFFGDNGQYLALASGVTLAPDGSFSVPAAGLHPIAYHLCRLRAVPAGSTVNSTRFAGPLLAVGGVLTTKVAGGPNAGLPYDFYLWDQQVGAAADYQSVGGCGVDNSYLFDQSLALTTMVFYCNALLNYRNLGGVADTRSEIQVDGQDAYDSTGASSVFARSAACPAACDGSIDNSGLPALNYSYSQNPTTGDMKINESEPLVRCAGAVPYPPTHATCSNFVPTGVRFARTIMQSQSGRVTTIVDRYSSADGLPHKVDLLYQNNQRVSGNGGVALDVGYRFPGQQTYSSYTRGDSLHVSGGAGTIYVRSLRADDGDAWTGQGAIVYDTGPSQILFMNPHATSSSSNFTMHYATRVPATGALRFRFAYCSDWTAAGVRALATPIEDGYAPPSIAITSPANHATVRTATITVRVTARDNVRVASVRVAGRAAARTGATSWRATVHLHVGVNRITAVAADGAGNTRSATITVAYHR